MQTAHAPIPAVLRVPLANRGTAFTDRDREHLGLAGLLPPRVETLVEQAARVMENLRGITAPIERYLYLSALQNENETLFYRVLLDNLQELLPIVYTPTVGQACQEWSLRYVRPRGLYLTPRDRGHIARILGHFGGSNIAMVVVTDGGRILGLGDLGANGMGIPIGKLALYTACAGIDPARCLPITLDVGTNTESIRNDAFYLGRREPRLTGPAYDEFLDEFVTAIQSIFPGAVLQFEDFNNEHAFHLLGRYSGRLCCFNDDVQGTGAMGLAGLNTACRITGGRLSDQRLLFAGAGQAALGIGEMAVSAMRSEGLTEGEARSRCLFMDSKGAIVTERGDLSKHKRRVAHHMEAPSSLGDAITAFKPSVLIGASGQGGLFTSTILKAMGEAAHRPVILALSNPTSKAECTAEQAYAHTHGQAIFASGSPFDPVTIASRSFAPGQANNSYIFPGVGLGLIYSGAKHVARPMFIAAAQALTRMVTEEDLRLGRVFPPQSKMRDVAASVAEAVAGVAFDHGLAGIPRPVNLAEALRGFMYQPEYH